MASRGQIKQKKQARSAAKKKVPDLFKKAAAKSDQTMATRLIRKARRMAMKFRMRIAPYKYQFCKHCYVRLVAGTNCRVRINNHKLTYYCLACKKFRRVPVGK